MSQSLEIEFKNGLTKLEYEKLLHYFHNNLKKQIKQTNIYFDTLNFALRNKGNVLRTRIKAAQIELTLKEKDTVGLLETTDLITQEDLHTLLNQHQLFSGEVKEKLIALNIVEPLYEIVRFTTHRYEFPYQGNLIAIDHSINDDMSDYELELETDDYEEGEKVFLNLLKKLEIPRKKTISKAKRFYEKKKREH